MWQPLQILAGLLVAAAGVLAIRGLGRRPPRPGALFMLLRILRRIAGVLIFLTGLAIVLEGTPLMTAEICLDLAENGEEWCFGGDDTAPESSGDQPVLLDSAEEEDTLDEGG
jgi:hypothetical protein